MLGSNNYLGLTTDARVRAAAAAAVSRYGTGITGSRLLNGTLTIHRELEELLADWVGLEAALVFTTGYAANLGLLGALVGRDDADRRGFGRPRQPGRRRPLLRGHPPGLPPQPGQQPAPHPAVVAGAAGRRRGRWWRWTASTPWRATGPRWPTSPPSARTSAPGCSSTRPTPWAWSGPGGPGTAAATGVRPDLIMGTFSKSLASCGGFVAGPRAVIDYLKVTCRPLMFTASGVPAALAAALEAARIAQTEDWRREAVAARAEQLRAGLAELGYRWRTQVQQPDRERARWATTGRPGCCGRP